MSEFELIAERRTEQGKGATRRLRREGQVPGILYGSGKDPVPLKVVDRYLRKQLENEAFFSHILTVKVDGEEAEAVVKALQRDPSTSEVTHMDLLRVSSTSELHMNVPLHFVNEDTSPGKKAGGVVSHLMVDLEIGCLPKDLPEYIEVDMAEMQVGDTLHLSDLKMPEGVKLMALAHDPDHDHPVVSVTHPQKLEVHEEIEGEELEEGVEVPTVSEQAEESGEE